MTGQKFQDQRSIWSSETKIKCFEIYLIEILNKSLIPLRGKKTLNSSDKTWNLAVKDKNKWHSPMTYLLPPTLFFLVSPRIRQIYMYYSHSWV